MKELLTMASNVFAAVSEEGKLIPRGEVVLVLSEPVYQVEPGGEVLRRRELSQVRFVSGPGALRKLADSLNLLANQAETLIPKT